MFEQLKEVAAPTAVNVAYATVHVLRGRRLTKKNVEGFISPTGGATPKLEMRLVHGLVAEIVKVEGKPLGQFSEKDISKYVGSLTGFVQDQVKVKTSSPEKLEILQRKIGKVKPGNGYRVIPAKKSRKQNIPTFKSAGRSAKV